MNRTREDRNPGWVEQGQIYRTTRILPHLYLGLRQYSHIVPEGLRIVDCFQTARYQENAIIGPMSESTDFAANCWYVSCFFN